MKGQAAGACRNVLDDPLVPARLAEASARLMHSLGNRDSGRIRHGGFDRYFAAAADGPRSDTSEFGGPSGQAGYELNILATLALWKGQHAFFEVLQDWLRSHMHGIAARLS